MSSSQPSKRSLYNILDVGEMATQAELRKAYSRLVKKLVPYQEHDKAAKKLKNAKMAYQILSDPVRRTKYDGKPRSLVNTPQVPPSTHCKRCQSMRTQPKSSAYPQFFGFCKDGMPRKRCIKQQCYCFQHLDQSKTTAAKGKRAKQPLVQSK